MSGTDKKIPPTGAHGRRPTNPTTSPTPSNRAPVRSPTPSSPSSQPNGGLPRTRSLRGSALSAGNPARRSVVGASGLSNSSSSTDAEEARAESIAAMDELKERLRMSEIRADQFQKETEVLQSRLEDALQEQVKLEDRLHEEEERVESLENEKRDAARQMREMGAIYEAERTSMTKEKEEMGNREEEMQVIIQRLKESLSQKANGDDDARSEGRGFRHSNNSSPSIESNNHFAPPSSLNRSDSRNNSKLLLQKDRVIESLRLEIAEAQIKIVESENMGGGRIQEIERQLLETRMTNARLMEDNESFQLLLSEKTLNGDFTKSDFGYMSSPARADALDALEGRTGGSSLADELSDVADGDIEAYRRLEAELKASKEQNKALTLYINKIIERLLEHQDFEAILDQSSDFKPGAAGTIQANTNKDLPPPPPPKEAAAGPSILQRAKSVVGGTRPKPRPMSQMPAAHSALTDPDTAPSIPFNLNRGTSVRKSRPASEQISSGAFSVVNAMYKGPAATSPPLHGPQTPRNSTSFFAPPAAAGNPNAAARAPSSNFALPSSGNFPGSRISGTSDGGSTTSTETSHTSHTGEVSTPPPGNSPPRAMDRQATFAGNKPRPLRLVQDQAETTAKADKRASWMGWAMNAVGKKEDGTGGEAGKE
ncbi:hypothetical protein V496_07277 [Pseudogymnoascus sp. VKM F-4515 (FW-2607)]|nr:hypothetical protein V496_07277 [Pseudogymnoascus sp. VKM F-4515 (FW-2607)]KFY75846.1 hypothetical protein V498_09879 [Pseudogymnoascus sp. VKM F-4517 (FW-2822)]